ncbi:MAG TPA: heme-binding protein, partial [Planctomycetota bacterium]|nr:heme-binding protein [Planctomycetota bacterium]
MTNLNNIEYAEDGRLFAAGYDGRLHVLRDTDGDGLEDQVTTFYGTKSDDYPLGMIVRNGDPIVLRRHAAIRHRDTNGDGVPDTEEVVATGWRDPEVDQASYVTHRRVDDALGLAVGSDGTFYVTMGAANYSNGYLLTKEGESRVDLRKRRGCLLALAPDGSGPKILATGVRFVVCMQFNKAGDLFGTDQEGATWLPNGNPFDELLHLQPGRHYGFPPRHPKHLPDVVDEPSVVDFAPQHQSTCGFRFNEPRPGRGRFGPPEWEGNAFTVAMSRGKIYRTELVKTAAGYVARNRQFASVNMLPIDIAISPKGDLVICCHSGAPDWGSGPKGSGKLFKISWKDHSAAQPLFAWPAGPGETGVAFDRPLSADSAREILKTASLESGLFVTAGDRFERFRPGYQVVKDQLKMPRFTHPILSSGLSADRRSILLRTAPRSSAVGYAVSLPGTAELAYDLSGVEAEWTSGSGADHWKGWLPHPDLAAAKAFTKGSVEHDRLWALLETPGRLVLRGQLDLHQMLQPAIQPGSTLDWEYPAEKVTVEFASAKDFRVESGPDTFREGRLMVTTSATWVPVAFSIATGPGTKLDISWHTDEDPRPRPLALRRTRVPWARPGEAAPRTLGVAPEIQGGR